jgi:hypothetical protein
MPISTVNQKGLDAPLTLTAPNLGTPSAINLANAVFPAGNVLQVVTGSTTTTSSTTSTTLTASNLSASITPKFTTSKILVLCGVSITNTTNGAFSNATIYRGSSTNLAGGTNVLSTYTMNGTSWVWIPSTMAITDSPATTSSTTYTVYFAASGGGTAYVNNSASTGTILLLEIAG